MEISEERLIEIVGTAVAQGLKAAKINHTCRYDYDPNEIDHVMGMVADMGDGDRRRGVETLRAIHLWAIKRVAKDEAYEANHKLVTTFREAGGSVIFKLAQVFVWSCIVVSIGTALIFFGGKIAPLIGR